MTYRIFKNRVRKAYLSTTIWFNTVGAAMLTAILVEPTFINYLNQHDLSIILMVGNILLRFKTTHDMADK